LNLYYKTFILGDVTSKVMEKKSNSRSFGKILHNSQNEILRCYNYDRYASTNAAGTSRDASGKAGDERRNEARNNGMIATSTNAST
jgi:hypothetical protein